MKMHTTYIYIHATNLRCYYLTVWSNLHIWRHWISLLQFHTIFRDIIYFVVPIECKNPNNLSDIPKSNFQKKFTHWSLKSNKLEQESVFFTRWKKALSLSEFPSDHCLCNSIDRTKCFIMKTDNKVLWN